MISEAVRSNGYCGEISEDSKRVWPVLAILGVAFVVSAMAATGGTRR